MAKVKRRNQVKKMLFFYKTNFGFEPPYKVLIDGTFCKEALVYKVNIREQLPKYLEADARLLTTACAKAECEKYGSTYDMPLYGPLKVISQYAIEPCGHKTPISPSDCFLRMAKKQDHYFFGTQDRDLSEKLRLIPGTALLYVAYNAIHLEPHSEASKSVAETKLQSKLEASTLEHERIKELKRKVFGEEEGDEPKKKRWKKIKGPNPLSCKRKKKKPVPNQTQSANPATRKRRRRHKNKTGVSVPETA